MLVEARRPFKAPHKMVQVGERFHAQDVLAKDLIHSGLVVACKAAQAPQNKMAATPQNKATAPDAGKAPAVGVVQPSSVSPAAQASPEPTAQPSETGAKRPTLRLRKPRAKRSRSTQPSE